MARGPEGRASCRRRSTLFPLSPWCRCSCTSSGAQTYEYAQGPLASCSHGCSAMWARRIAAMKLIAISCVLWTSACGAQLEEDTSNAESVSGCVDDQPSGMSALASMPETPTDDPTIAEAALAVSSWGTACRIGCWTAAGMGCAAVGAACTGSTVITIGGTSMPCAWALIAACGVLSGGAQYCAERLCPP